MLNKIGVMLGGGSTVLAEPRFLGVTIQKTGVENFYSGSTLPVDGLDSVKVTDSINQFTVTPSSRRSFPIHPAAESMSDNLTRPVQAARIRCFYNGFRDGTEVAYHGEERVTESRI